MPYCQSTMLVPRISIRVFRSSSTCILIYRDVGSSNSRSFTPVYTTPTQLYFGYEVVQPLLECWHGIHWTLSKVDDVTSKCSTYLDAIMHLASAAKTEQGNVLCILALYTIA